MMDPNSLDISRRVRVMLDASEFSSILRRAAFDTPPAPVRVLFSIDGITIWTMDLAKQAGVFINLEVPSTYSLRADEDGVRNPCVMLVCPRELADMLDAKCSGEAVRISTDANEKIVVKLRDGSGFDLLPADESECLTIPPSLTFSIGSEGFRTFPSADGAEATFACSMSLEEIRKGTVDMQMSKAPYVEFRFDRRGSTCCSGHWTRKSSKSWTQIDATIVHGDMTTIRFTDNLAKLLSRFGPYTETVGISTHEDVGLVLLETPGCLVVATEAIKEGI